MLGQQAKFTPLIGGESVEISDRTATGKITLDLTAAQQVAAMADVKANTLTSLGFVHGTSAGYKVCVFAPAAQRINPSFQDVDGRAMSSYDLRLTPLIGNDELRIVAL